MMLSLANQARSTYIQNGILPTMMLRYTKRKVMHRENYMASHSLFIGEFAVVIEPLLESRDLTFGNDCLQDDRSSRRVSLNNISTRGLEHLLR